MSKILSTIFGKFPVTSIVGYLLAGLTALDEILKSGETNYFKIASAVLLAVFGRYAADSNKVKPKGGADDDGPGSTNPPGNPPTKP